VLNSFEKDGCSSRLPSWLSKCAQENVFRQAMIRLEEFFKRNENSYIPTTRFCLFFNSKVKNHLIDKLILIVLGPCPIKRQIPLVFNLTVIRRLQLTQKTHPNALVDLFSSNSNYRSYFQA